MAMFDVLTVPECTAFQLLSSAFFLRVTFGTIFFLGFLFFNIPLDSSSVFLATTSSIPLSPVQFFWFKILSCLFLFLLSLQYYLQFLLVSNFLQEQHSSSSSVYCVFSSNSINFPSFVGFSCKSYSLFSFCLTFLLCLSLPYVSSYPVLNFFISHVTFSPSPHASSYPIFLFLSNFLLTFSPSPHLSSYPGVLFLSISEMSGCRNMCVDLG